MKISKKNCETLARYGQGAAARREATKVKVGFMEEICCKWSFNPLIFPDRTSKAYLSWWRKAATSFRKSASNFQRGALEISEWRIRRQISCLDQLLQAHSWCCQFNGSKLAEEVQGPVEKRPEDVGRTWHNRVPWWLHLSRHDKKWV